MDALLDGRVAVVTGAAGGIGRAVAEVFHTNGAAVVLADLDGSAAGALAEELGERALGVECDVAADGGMAAVVERAVASFGTVDVLVNNAGITRDGSLMRLTAEDFDRVVAVHLRGGWLGLKAVVPIMRAAKRGSIVNMSSISGKIGNPGQTNYSAAKAGLVGMTKAAAKELAKHGVRVNAIQPGLIRTPMIEAMTPEALAEREASIPLGRAGRAEEVANAALFLASDLSSYVTGIVLEVAGGRGI